MDWQTQQEDILDVLLFTEKLLAFLVTLVPPPHARQYRRVWNRQIKLKLQSIQQEIKTLGSNSPEWIRLDEVGWDPESARLKSDTISAESGAGKLASTLHLVNSALGSLSGVFRLEPVKEFKEFLETFVKGRSEPEPYIQTLFGPGPIPS